MQVLASLWAELQEWGKRSTAKWLGYLSSTSVYGDWGGAWVDERCMPLLSSAHSCKTCHVMGTLQGMPIDQESRTAERSSGYCVGLSCKILPQKKRVDLLLDVAGE